MWLGGRGLPNMSKAPDSIPTSTKKGVWGGVVQWVKVLATKSGNLSWISKIQVVLQGVLRPLLIPPRQHIK